MKGSKKMSVLAIFVIAVVALAFNVSASVTGATSVEEGTSEVYSVLLESPSPIVSDWTSGVFEVRWCGVGHLDNSVQDGVSGSVVEVQDWEVCGDTYETDFTAFFNTTGTHIIKGVMIQSRYEWNGLEWDLTQEWEIVDLDSLSVDVSRAMFAPSASPPPSVYYFLN